MRERPGEVWVGGRVGAHAAVGGPNTTAANNNPWQYTSGLLDGPTGLYKYGQRYYNPALGSWTQTRQH